MLALYSPFLVHSYHAVVIEGLHNGNETREFEHPFGFDYGQKWHCSRFIEAKGLTNSASHIAAANLMFRFFLIKYADQGFVSNGYVNLRLLNICFIIYLIFSFTGKAGSIFLSHVTSPNYPKDLVLGRICMNLR